MWLTIGRDRIFWHEIYWQWTEDSRNSQIVLENRLYSRGFYSNHVGGIEFFDTRSFDTEPKTQGIHKSPKKIVFILEGFTRTMWLTIGRDRIFWHEVFWHWTKNSRNSQIALENRLYIRGFYSNHVGGIEFFDTRSFDTEPKTQGIHKSPSKIVFIVEGFTRTMWAG